MTTLRLLTVTHLPPQNGTGAAMDNDVPQEITDHLTHLTLSGMSAGTIYGRARCLARLAAALPVPLLRALPEDLLTWRASMDGLSAGTIYNYATHARQFYTWAIHRGLIRGENPCDGLPVPRRPERVPRPISEADLTEAVIAARRRIRLWLVLAGWAGLRACEIARLRCENIDLSRRVLIVASDATKGRRERVIALCDFAAGEVTAARLPPRGWAFTRRDGQPGHVPAALVSKIANRHLARCGISATLHQLRHRFGTEAYRTTRDILGVKELMGHKSTATTTLYTLADQPAQAAIVQALPVPRRLRRAG